MSKRTLPYQTKESVLKREYGKLNNLLFDGKLPKRRHSFCVMKKKYVWAHYIPCIQTFSKTEYRSGLFEMNEAYRSKAHMLEILAHEMVHHYQWTVELIDPNHGNSFNEWKSIFSERGFNLSR